MSDYWDHNDDVDNGVYDIDNEEVFQVDVIGGVPWETVTLTTLGRRRELLLGMVEEARKGGCVMNSKLSKHLP